MRPEITPQSLALEAAVIGCEAGRILLRYFDRLEPHHIEEKTSHRDLLSIADGEAERHVIESIRKRFPAHSILGEENGFIEGDEYCWIIDPLDGTTNFVHSFPAYAVSIGVLYRGEPIAGVVEGPSLRETFVAWQGGGCWLNGRRCAVSKTATIARSILATGFSYNRNEVARNNVDNFSKLILKAHDIRRPGAASLDLAYVAAGRFDGFWEPYLQPWDVTAGALMVREAGGMVSDYAGSTSGRDYLWHENIVATNGRIHKELLCDVSGVEPGYQARFANFAAQW